MESAGGTNNNNIDSMIPIIICENLTCGWSQSIVVGTSITNTNRTLNPRILNLYEISTQNLIWLDYMCPIRIWVVIWNLDIDTQYIDIQYLIVLSEKVKLGVLTTPLLGQEHWEQKPELGHCSRCFSNTSNNTQTHYLQIIRLNLMSSLIDSVGYQDQ